MTEEYRTENEHYTAEQDGQNKGGKGPRRWIGQLSRKQLGIGLGAVALLAFIMLFVIPLMSKTYYEYKPYTSIETYYETEPYAANVTYLEKEPYTTIETYYELEPYTATETYFEMEPYSAWLDIDYLVTDSGRSYWLTAPNTTYWLTIKNIDTRGGNFDIALTLIPQYGAPISYSRSQYIGAGEEVVIEQVHYGDYLNDFTYSIDPPKKEGIAYREVLKTREVIKYRDVQKTREVTKYRDVERTREVIRYRDVGKTREVTLFEEVKRKDRMTVIEYLTD